MTQLHEGNKDGDQRDNVENGHENRLLFWPAHVTLGHYATGRYIAIVNGVNLEPVNSILQIDEATLDGDSNDDLEDVNNQNRRQRGQNIGDARFNQRRTASRLMRQDGLWSFFFVD